MCSRKFFTPSDIPDEVQYFAWAPEGNKLVSLDGQMIGCMYITFSDTPALKGVMDEVIGHNLPQTLEQSEKASKWVSEGSENKRG